MFRHTGFSLAFSKLSLQLVRGLGLELAREALALLALLVANGPSHCRGFLVGNKVFGSGSELEGVSLAVSRSLRRLFLPSCVGTYSLLSTVRVMESLPKESDKHRTPPSPSKRHSSYVLMRSPTGSTMHTLTFHALRLEGAYVSWSIRESAEVYQSVFCGGTIT